MFNNGKFVKRTDNNYNLLASISSKENYPSIQTGSTSINYKTGITTSSKNLAFDFYSGEVIKTLLTDGFGSTYVTEVKPAYTIYPLMAMKEHYQFDPAKSYNEHMITQVAGSATYKVSDETSLNKLALVSASAQTWSNQINVLGIGTSGTNAHNTMSGASDLVIIL
ncbi:MAG: hypothetical protein IPJ20_19540 [Flammeovirgaceae bacterium]|nr:hypothetical protein [Flammeovirgaceae bacterium]